MRKTPQLLVALAVMSVIGWGLLRRSVSAQEHPAAEPAPVPPEVRIYDVREFLLPGDTNYGGGGFGVSKIVEVTQESTNSLFTEAWQGGQTTAQTVTSIIDTIKETIAPESWRDKGGTVGSIRELNGQLLINQTPDAQAAIRKLLADLRAPLDIQVDVEAQMLAVDQKTLEAISAKGPFLTAKEVETLKAGAAKIKLLAAPRALMFSGRKAFLSHTSSREFIQSFRRELQGGDGKGATTQPGAVAQEVLEPVIEELTSGATFCACAIPSPDRSRVTLEFSEKRGMPKLSPQRALPGVAGEKGFTTQSPELQTAVVDMKFSVPNGMYAVLSGEGFTQSKDDALDGESTFLLYLVRATVVPPPAPAAGPSAKP